MRFQKIVRAIVFNLVVFTASAASGNVCNLDALYADGFNYPIQRKALESFFDGKAYDHKSSYTPEERERLEADINEIYSRCKGTQKSSPPVITVTAGAPGTGKTMLMKALLKSEGSVAAYICPDDVCLQSMSSTYQAELKSRLKELSKTQFASAEEAQLAEKNVRLELYNKWRPASNAATHVILANLIKEKRDIFFGTTSSGPLTANSFRFYKEHGYKIRVVHCSAPDAVRWGSIKERDQTFVQTTEQDIVEKGDLISQRLRDTFQELADEILFYHRGAVKEEAVLAATWIRDSGVGQPTLTVLDAPRYEAIKKIHNAVCDKLKRPDLDWETVIDKMAVVR